MTVSPGARRDESPGPDLEALFDDHYAQLVRIAGLLTRDGDRAERIAQDAFVQLLRRRDQPSDPAEAVVALHSGVVSGCRSVLRRGRLTRRSSTDTLLDVSGDAGGGQAFVGLQQAEILDRLAELPGRQREVLVLCYYARLGEAEAARVLSISPDAVEELRTSGLAALGPVLTGRR